MSLVRGAPGPQAGQDGRLHRAAATTQNAPMRGPLTFLQGGRMRQVGF